MNYNNYYEHIYNCNIGAIFSLRELWLRCSRVFIFTGTVHCYSQHAVLINLLNVYIERTAKCVRYNLCTLGLNDMNTNFKLNSYRYFYLNYSYNIIVQFCAKA